jgi:hypothetical protein
VWRRGLSPAACDLGRLTLALVAIALVATIFHRELRDAAIRRAG